jgi:hypothetical protein
MSLCISKSDISWPQGRRNQTHNFLESCMECVVEPISSVYTILARPFKEQNTTSSAESIFAEEILNHFYMRGDKIISPLRVSEYLRNYPEIAELSKRVSDEVHQYFDFRAQLSLGVQDDGVPDSDYLTIYIRVPEYDNSVMDRIRMIRESYYDLLNNMTGWFLLTTDFSPPR